MRIHVLFVYSGNKKPRTFITEQKKSLLEEGIQVDDFRINGKGVLGYLKNLRPLYSKIRNGSYDLIHAHYGLSGLLSTFQRLLPTVITFHGSDVNQKNNLFFSFLASRLSSYNIIVNDNMAKMLLLNEKYKVLPCGVDFDLFYPIKKEKARKELGLDLTKNFVLFSSGFDNPIKNFPLAKKAVKFLNEPVEILELKNKSRREVNLLFNACDLLLMTSFSEGSPQVIKEALASNTPIISTDVGDVKRMVKGVKNCFITSYEPKDIAHKIEIVLADRERPNSRELIKEFDIQKIAKEIKNIYMKLIKNICK